MKSQQLIWGVLVLGWVGLGIGLMGCGGGSSGSSAPAPAEDHPVVPDFALVGSLNHNGYDDVKAWIGKYRASDGAHGRTGTQAVQYNPNANDEVYAMTQDSDNNSYIIGHKGDSYIIAKYDIDGAVKWEHAIAAQPFKLIVKHSALYVGGVIATEAGIDDIWVGQYDLSDGTPQWALTKKGAGQGSVDHFINWIVQDDGTVYVLGMIGNDDFDIWLGKTVTGTCWNWDLTYDSIGHTDYPRALLLNQSVVCVLGGSNDGNDLWLGATITGTYWNTSLTRTNSYPTAFAADTAHNIYVLGTVNNSSDFDIWLGKTSNGIAWSHEITRTNTGYDESTALVISGTHVCALGTIRNVLNASDIWLGQTDDGVAWDTEITKTDNANVSCMATAAAMDKDNNVYVLGSVHNGLNYDIWLGKTADGLTWDRQNPKNRNSADAYANVLYVDDVGTAYVLGLVGDGSGRSGIWLGKAQTAGTGWETEFLNDGTNPSAADTPVDLAVSGANIFILGEVINNNTGRDTWLAKTTDGVNSDWADYGYGVGTNNILSKIDSLGNIYVATIITVFEPVTQTAVWLAKFDKSLDLTWALTKTSADADSTYLTDLIVDHENNVYLLGTMNNGSDTDIWLSKTITGTYWNYDLSYDSGDDDDVACALAINNSGEVYVLGRVDNGSDYDIWLGKTVTGTYWNGDLSLDYDSDDDYPRSLALDSAGHAYVLGGVYDSGSGNDIWLGKALADGSDWEWSLNYDYDGTDDYPVEFYVKQPDEVYVLGQLDYSPNIIWLTKTISNSGSIQQWDWNFDSYNLDYDIYPLGLLVDQAGAAYVVGQSDNGDDTGDNIWLGKTSDGDSWDYTVSKTGTAYESYDYPVSWSQDNAGNVFILGSIVMTPTQGSRNIWFGQYVDGILQGEISKEGGDKLDDYAVNFAFDDHGAAYIFGNIFMFDYGYRSWVGKYKEGAETVWEIIKTANENAWLYNLLPLKAGWTVGQLCEQAAR